MGLRHVLPMGLFVAKAPPPPPPPPPPVLAPGLLYALLPPWRTADGQPLPVGTALLLILVTLSWLRRPATKGARPRVHAGSSFTERLAYRVDNFFSTKAYAPAALLCVITLILVVVGGLALWLATDDSTLLSMMWLAWRFVTDGGDYDEQAAPRVVGVVLVLSGMLFFALLVGLIGESIQSRLDDLKQGRNRVIEQGHTLVLGWSDKFVPLAREIANANASEGGGVVVVLADSHEKDVMDDIIANELPEDELQGTQIVCRTGDPVSLHALKKVSAADARAIVVLADYAVTADHSDARAVRCMLALRAGIETKGHTVVEMRDIDNLPTLELVTEMQIDNSASGDEPDDAPVVRTLVPHDIIGRLMIQCARQRNLAEVYDALCGFDGMEFYFKQWPELSGLTWGDAIFSFPAACPIGVRRAVPDRAISPAARAKQDAAFANPRWAGIILNPDDSLVLRDGDEILVVAEDDDTYRPAPPARPPVAVLPAWSMAKRLNENVLLVGWRRDLYDMLQELDKYVQKGCVVSVLAPVPVEDRQELLESGKAGPLVLHNINLNHVCGSTTHRRDIEGVMHACPFSSVLVLSAEGGGDARGDSHGTTLSMEASEDSRALTSLLLVRDIRQTLLKQEAATAAALTSAGAKGLAAATEAQPEDFTLLGEILDMETKDLVATAGISDYIMSNRLMSKVMAMVAENEAIGPLLDILFAEEGDEIYVRDVRFYCTPGEALSFWQLSGRARGRGDILLGYKRGGAEVALNPDNKSDYLVWGVGDYVIVLGDDNPDDDE